MFINLSNHPSGEWSEEQLLAARCYGEVIDMAFPQVDPNAAPDEVKRLAEECVAQILTKGGADSITVHVMGEMNLTHHIVTALQERGVQCVASTTERQAVEMPDGSKQSTFGFVQFRNYESPAVSMPVRDSKCGNQPQGSRLSCFDNKNAYSLLAGIIVLVAELTAIVLGRNGAWGWLIGAEAVFAGLILLLWLQVRSRGLKFTIRSEIMTRLLANTVAPQRLGVVYLLAFVIHLGWLADNVLYLLTPANGPFVDIVLPLVTCALGLLVLILFFPDGRKRKDASPATVFVSGISLVKVPHNNQYKDLTLRPLVRVLQNVTDGNCEMLVVLSDFGHRDKNEIASDINGVLRFIGSSSIVDERMTVPEQLAVAIREVAKREFPDKGEWIDKMPIHFTEPCNYNVFSQCFATLSPWVKAKDDARHKLVFNLSPGTGVIGSLMTLMAINADRDLYYYSQDSRLPDEQRLVMVDKASVPLHNLLSQALENVEKGG